MKVTRSSFVLILCSFIPVLRCHQATGFVFMQPLATIEANNKRRNDLEEGRNFLEQINWDSRRMMKLMQSEKSKVTNELKMAWDRDTHVKNVLKLRRKMLKKGRSSFLISFLKNPSLLNILSQSIPPTLFI